MKHFIKLILLWTASSSMAIEYCPLSRDCSIFEETSVAGLHDFIPCALTSSGSGTICNEVPSIISLPDPFPFTSKCDNDSNCQCPNGGCNMPNCKSNCQCAGGFCSMPKCEFNCQCAGGFCTMSQCLAGCGCDSISPQVGYGHCDMDCCEENCRCSDGTCNKEVSVTSTILYNGRVITFCDAGDSKEEGDIPAGYFWGNEKETCLGYHSQCNPDYKKDDSNIPASRAKCCMTSCYIDSGGHASCMNDPNPGDWLPFLAIPATVIIGIGLFWWKKNNDGNIAINNEDQHIPFSGPQVTEVTPEPVPITIEIT